MYTRATLNKKILLDRTTDQNHAQFNCRSQPTRYQGGVEFSADLHQHYLRVLLFRFDNSLC